MGQKRKKITFDKIRKVVVGQFHFENDTRALRKDLCSFEELRYSILPSGQKRERSETQRETYTSKLYQEKLRAILAERERKHRIIDQTKTFKHISSLWLQSVGSSRSYSTLKCYDLTIKYYLESTSDYILIEHQPEYITKFQLYLAQKGFTASNKNKHERQLTAFFNWAYRKGLLDRPIHIDKTKVSQQAIERYSDDEMAALHSLLKENKEKAATEAQKITAKNDLRAFIFLANTACRRGEVLMMRLQHIDLDEKMITITGNEEKGWNPKSKTFRTIQISPRFLSFLITDIEERGETEKYYLDNGKGEPYLKHFDSITKHFADHINSLGLKSSKPRLKPLHGIRATGLTRISKGGANAFQIQSIAGHSDIATTLNYVSSDIEEQRIAMESISSLKFS